MNGFCLAITQIVVLRGAVVARVTQEPQIPGLISRPATYFLFLLPLIHEGQSSVSGESMCT